MLDERLWGGRLWGEIPLVERLLVEFLLGEISLGDRRAGDHRRPAVSVNPALPAAGALAAVALWVYPLDPRWSRPRPRGRAGVEVPPVVRRTCVLLVGVVAVGMLTGANWWLLVGAAATVGVLSARLPVPVPAGRRRAERASLILHADLLAACLDAGMALSAALSAVSGLLDRLDRPDGPAGPGRPVGAREPGRDRARPGRIRATRGDGRIGRIRAGVDRAAGGRSGARPSGTEGVGAGRAGERRTGRSVRPGGATARARLRSVAALFELGASPAVAWEPADGHPDLRELAGAARRSAVAGTPLAEAARQQAALLRAARAAEVQRSAGRAGVAMTAPLGLCFLPAFLCLGLAPVVVGLLGTLGIF